MLTIANAAVVYTADFSNISHDEKGGIGPSNQVDTSGVDWTIDISSATLSAVDDFFKVNNQQFEGQDIDGEAIWLSPVINISSFTNINLSVEFNEAGTAESSDFLKASYKLDGGTETFFDTNGQNIDDFTSVTATHSGLNGSSVQVIIRASNNAATELHSFDNVLVEGTAIPEVSNISLIIGLFSLVILSCRKKD